LLSSCWF